MRSNVFPSAPLEPDPDASLVGSLLRFLTGDISRAGYAHLKDDASAQQLKRLVKMGGSKRSDPVVAAVQVSCQKVSRLEFFAQGCKLRVVKCEFRSGSAVAVVRDVAQDVVRSLAS